MLICSTENMEHCEFEIRLYILCMGISSVSESVLNQIDGIVNSLNFREFFVMASLAYRLKYSFIIFEITLMSGQVARVTDSERCL